MFLTHCSPSHAQAVVLVLMAGLILPYYPIRVGAARGAAEQERAGKTLPVVTDATYKRVLDAVFPVDDPEPAKTFLVITLRFVPNSQPESQITIRRGVQKSEVVEYTSLSGNIYQRLNERLAGGEREDPVEMAKHFTARKRTVDVPITHVRRWHERFLGAVGRSTTVLRHRAAIFDRTREESLPVHGTFYELWYKQGLSTMSFSFYDYEVNQSASTGEFKVVQWMNTIRLEVQKLSGR